MAKETEGEVQAEVLLRNPQPATFDKVAHFLQQQGVEVTSRGAAALSIRCPLPVFERLFQVRLRRAAPEVPRPGVRDYGPASRSAYQSDSVAVVPSALADEVEGVYLQGPARLL
jgi:hypothetical protein